MFSQFGATAETLSKASTMVFRIGTDAHLYDDPEDVNIAPLLDSKFDSEKCEALKRLLALIAQGFDVSNFFPQVVKNVASQSLEVKKLVYLYLLHYAEKRPNEALLSINCFQKDLGDPNPLVRAWALRTMAGIRLHVIAPIVLVAVSKCARDPSVYVRKCAANALPKLYDLHLEENTTSLEELVGLLLNDHSPGVVGAAAAAFTSVCPNNFPLVGRYYRRLCETLPDVEEWGQIVMTGILLRYVIAKYGLVKESIMAIHGTKDNLSYKNGSNDSSALEEPCESSIAMSDLVDMVSRSYIEGPDEYLSRSGHADKSCSRVALTCLTSSQNNEDIKILLQCTSPLLWSHNSAVVLAAAGVHWIMAPREEIRRIVKPLLFLMRSSNASKYVVLSNIQVFAKAMPSLFAPHFEEFFVCSKDSYQIKALKLGIMSSIATDSSISSILFEFQDYVRDPDRRFAADAVAAIGLCAQRLPKMAKACLESLLALIRQESLIDDFLAENGEANVLIQAILSIKTIIKQGPLNYEKIIIQLVRSLDSIRVPAARAMIIWMVGEYNSVGQLIPRMLATVLKYLARCFTSEALETKLQILNATAKVLLSAKDEHVWTFKSILNYVLELAKCDMNYDIRDRARVMQKLLSSTLGSQDLGEDTQCLPEMTGLSHMLAKHILGGQVNSTSTKSINHRFYLPGSLSQIVLHAAPGYEPLPKPCSLQAPESEVLGDGDAGNDLGSGSSDENTSDYDSQGSFSSSSGTGGTDDTQSAAEVDEDAGSLIQFSEIGNVHGRQNRGSQDNDMHSDASDVGALLSKTALESWLDEQPSFSSMKLSQQTERLKSSAKISLRDISSRIRPKTYTLLDPAYGDGLKAVYSFSSEISSISPLLVCLEVSFTNCSSEPMSKISLTDEELDKGPESADRALVNRESASTPEHDLPTLIPMEEISSLEPGQAMKVILQVRFNHHLLPLKLALWCNGKKHAVKLRPDIGYFVKPLPMDIKAFKDKESQLPGMFEYVRSCIFKDHIEKLKKDDWSPSKDKFIVICECLALKILSNANLSLVSVDMPISANFDDASGLCLRFSSEILSNSIPCLVTILVDGKCSEPLNVSVKVNCEETVFGLNLLNRINVAIGYKSTPEVTLRHPQSLAYATAVALEPESSTCL
ncbi:AP-3 complex subunit beta, C-terminal domain [Dillenia turbinata]|uniref:AP-3 complex subunit beta n=1 Tax=Dillenia turbinata TaxID=194707 RepID=A0AAN8ZGK3_9MAGN